MVFVFIYLAGDAGGCLCRIAFGCLNSSFAEVASLWSSAIIFYKYLQSASNLAVSATTS